MRKILVIEDNEMNREMLREIISEEYDVLEAENGAVGLDLLEEYHRDLSVILLDLQMPVMDGFEFMTRVKQDPLLSAVPIIVMTADEKPDNEARCMDLGAVEFLEKPYNPVIMFGRIQNIIRMREAAADIRSIEHDELGIYTRQAFNHYAAKEIRDNPDKNYTLFIVDVKDFKLINSVYGSAAGDLILKTIAKKLQQDANEYNGLVGHYGADKFIGMFEQELVPEVAQLDKLVSQVTEIDPVERIRIKIGLYENVDRELSITAICDRAIIALDQVKQVYDINVGSYDGPAATKYRQEKLLENDFSRAVEADEFVPWFQPKIDPNTNTLVGAEALVRWKREDGTYNPPYMFIPVFEKDGLVADLDEIMYRKVCDFQKRRSEEGKPCVPISVNMSRITLHRSNTVEHYLKFIEGSGVPIDLVPVEITESSAFESIRFGQLLNKLKEEGFSLHMDDFGSGYSSLTSMSVMPFDVIKIDKSLTDAIGGERGETVLRHIMEMIRELGMKVVVEGVEEEAQVEFLKKLGCDAIQGYYYSKPVCMEDFEKMMESYLG